jgi:cellulose synthase (UDP-forming)
MEYRRLASRLDVELSVFERNKYVNLSHAANKAMNLNSYIGLMGKQFTEVQQIGGLWLYCANKADATLIVPAPDYLINLDADTLLLSDYAVRTFCSTSTSWSATNIAIGRQIGDPG